MNRINASHPILLLALMLAMAICGDLNAQGKDNPNPPADMQIIPAGSYIIGMDNNTQQYLGNFNFKAYGLVNALLKNGVPVKWAIRSGKLKDEIDFTSFVRKKFPTTGADQNINFRSGAFIIHANHTSSADTIIASFANFVEVYRMQQADTIDIRYTINQAPNIALLDNGGNAIMHENILLHAGIPDYTMMMANAVVDSNSCYTFASEPHWSSDQEEDTTETQAIRDFVMSGANFFAQCAGVETYSYFNHFHATLGVKELGKDILNQYHNVDMAIAQFVGPVEENPGGHVENWTLAPGSSWNSGFYRIISHTNDDTLACAAAKLRNYNEIGGNVFYMGGHDYFDRNPNIGELNGMRVYLNSVFIPAIRPPHCWPTNMLPVTLSSFHAQADEENRVELDWATESESNSNYFVVERSLNGHHFAAAGRVDAAGNSTARNRYSLTDSNSTHLKGKVYYRLRSVDLDGTQHVSQVIEVIMTDTEEGITAVYPNPIKPGGEFNFEYYQNETKALTLQVFNQTGAMVYQSQTEADKGTREFTLSTQGWEPGIYFLKISSWNNEVSKKLLVR